MSMDLKSLERKVGVSLLTAEKYWKEARARAKAENKLNNYAYTMGLVKQRLDLKKEDLVLCGWPIRLVVEAEAYIGLLTGPENDTTFQTSPLDNTASPPADMSPETSPLENSPIKELFFSMEGIKPDQRNGILKSLTDAGHTVIWEFLEGEVICVPKLTEEQFASLSTLLKSSGINAEQNGGRDNETAESILTALFVMEFCRRSIGGKSSIVLEGGKIDSVKVMKEASETGSSSSFKTWLMSLFPNCAPEMIEFMVGQNR